MHVLSYICHISFIFFVSFSCYHRKENEFLHCKILNRNENKKSKNGICVDLKRCNIKKREISVLFFQFKKLFHEYFFNLAWCDGLLVVISHSVRIKEEQKLELEQVVLYISGIDDSKMCDNSWGSGTFWWMN